MRRLVLALALLASPARADPSISVAFSPGGSTAAVIQAINESQHVLRLAGYGFTSPPIAQALIAAYSRGVDIKIVLDKSNLTAKRTEAAEVSQAGIPVRIDSHYPIMHSKYLVIDGRTVEMGSFNFTTQAAKNAENLIVLRDDPTIAAVYEQNWEGLWVESQPYEAPMP